MTESEIVNIEQKGTPISGHKEKGASWEKGSTSFHITMSSGVTYSLRIEYWFKSEVDSAVEGLNRVLFMNLEDSYLDSYDRDKFSDRSGIYNPNWGDFQFS